MSFLRALAKFQARVHKTDSCWVWTGYRFPSGYGNTKWDGERYAHRFAYYVEHGPFPRGRHVLHTCDNPPCVNPSHLRLGSPQENVRDSVEKGRFHLHLATGYRLDGSPTKRRLEGRL